MQFLQNTNILCLTFSELVPDIMPKGTYDSAKSRGAIKVHGKGGNGNQVLIEFESLSLKHRKLVEAKFGNPYEYHAKQPLLNLVIEDIQARAYYANYRLADGRYLPNGLDNKGNYSKEQDFQLRYSRQADWLNMIIKIGNDDQAIKQVLNISKAQFWSNVIELYTADPIPHKLPTSRRRLDDKLNKYEAEGYKGLVDPKFGNQNTRKVDKKIERLLLALYCMPEKPYLRSVCQFYSDFIDGKIQVVDLETAELFDPAEFMVNGQPYKVSESTVKYYIDDNPINRAVVDKFRLSQLQWANIHQPHMSRRAPMYSLSKITMDDTSSPFKMHDGKRPATYKVFDVASGAMIAMVMHKRERPDVPLIRRLLADMFSLIVKNGWKMPFEIEIERALTSAMTGEKDKDGNTIQEDVLSAGVVFPFVHFCAPRNPQEKRAEGFIKQIKYTYQKRREGFQSRPFSRNTANRFNEDSKFHKATFMFEDIYKMELEDMQSWNNELHPDQEQYKGMTRWQVLEQCQNPNLQTVDLPFILPYIGYRQETSLKRQYVQVQYGKYKLAEPAKAASLHLVNNSVLAYYLKDYNGQAEHVHLYEKNGEYICQALPVEQYNESRAEETAEDKAIKSRQEEYKAHFNNTVKDIAESLKRVAVVPVKPEQEQGVEPEPEMVNTGVSEPENESYDGGFRPENEENDPWFTDVEQAGKRAIKGI